MGRAPCCDKANVKKGPWAPEEDSKLKSYIEKHGTGGNWISLPQKIGLKRCGKSCRLRWLNYLRPNLKHGGFSEEEDNIICTLYTSIGSRWSIIAAQLPGRTDNDIKNYWNTRLKKKLLGKQRKEQQARRSNNFIKQEMKKIDQTDHSYNFMSVPDQAVNLIYPYWPQLPVAMSASNPNLIQDPRVINNDESSIRNLLVKLGGRFSNDQLLQQQQQQQQQQPIVTSNFHYPQDQVNGNSNNSMINNDYPQLVNEGGVSTYYPIFNNDNVFNENVKQLGGLIMESGGLDHHELGINGSTTTTTTTNSTESSSWGDLNSLVCAPDLPLDHMFLNYEDNCAQEMILQSYVFDAFQ